MTAINCLVEVAGTMTDSELHGSMAVVQGAGSSIQALCESFLATLSGITPYDFFRAEFRMPAGPPDFKQDPEQESSPQRSSVVNVGVNVYAIARQIQEALDHIRTEAVNVPEAFSSYALPLESPNVSTSDVSFSKEYSRELMKDHSREFSHEAIKEPGTEAIRAPGVIVPSPLPAKPAGRAPDSPWYHSGKKDMLEKQSAHSPEANIKRSMLVISQLENVIRNVVSTESIVNEGRESSSAIKQLHNVRLNMLSPPAVAPPAQTSAEGPSIRQGLSQQRQPEIAQDTQRTTQWQSGIKKEDRPVYEPGLPAVAGDAVRAATSLQKVSTDTAANATSLSDALSRSISVPAGPMLAGAQESMVKAELPPMGEMHLSPVTQASRALAAINNSYGAASNYSGSSQAPIVRLMMAGLRGISPSMGAVYNAGYSIETLSKTGSGMMQQNPIFGLINNVALPRASAAPEDVLVQMSGAISPMAGEPVRPHLANPAVHLAVSLAAAQAVQRAGTSVIKEFVMASPSMSGGFQAPAPGDRNIVNVSMPGVTVEREMSSSVNRVSNFHNTFNINVTMKGGGEEGDLKELGKKIGRILSDEIKRYGGV